jgi:hypothetical protein
MTSAPSRAALRAPRVPVRPGEGGGGRIRASCPRGHGT